MTAKRLCEKCQKRRAQEFGRCRQCQSAISGLRHMDARFYSRNILRPRVQTVKSNGSAWIGLDRAHFQAYVALRFQSAADSACFPEMIDIVRQREVPRRVFESTYDATVNRPPKRV